MGQLTASIAHEVNQPIAAARNNAASARRFLSRSPPDLEEVREALGCIANDVDRAGDVIGGIRKLITKAPAPRHDCLDVNEAIREVIVLTRGEALKNGVSVEMQLAAGLPLIQGHRVQLQQVVLNLILNAVEAMSSVDDARRELLISTERSEAHEVLIAVGDLGPGIDPEHRERVFDSFYMSLSGCAGPG
jgi:C4-dicarboxylate-specific signal transduction histidine kinase